MKSGNTIQSGISRRRFLTMGAGVAMALAGAPALAAGSKLALGSGERTLSFSNLHTGETLKTTYWQDGIYLPDEMTAINHVLRDFRVNLAGDMSPHLMDMLYLLQEKLDTTQPYQVISGYRSPKTNAMLHNTTPGVATRSRHMLGQAIDVRLHEKDMKHLLKAAYNLRAGGVGYYPHSDFIHLDVGPYRTWKG